MSKQDRQAVQDDDSCSCKVGRNADRYDLDRLDRRLLDRREEGASLRRLETVVNHAVLRSALREATTDVIGDVDGIYETLTDDAATAGERTELTERLTRAGIDAATLREDFVSYQTVRTHLRECLDVDTDRSQSLTPADAQGTIEWARSRSEGIVERTIERLADTEDFDAGDVDVTYAVRVTCGDCGGSYPVETFVARGGCECHDAG